MEEQRLTGSLIITCFSWIPLRQECVLKSSAWGKCCSSLAFRGILQLFRVHGSHSKLLYFHFYNTRLNTRMSSPVRTLILQVWARISQKADMHLAGSPFLLSETDSQVKCLRHLLNLAPDYRGQLSQYWGTSGPGLGTRTQDQQGKARASLKIYLNLLTQKNTFIYLNILNTKLFTLRMLTIHKSLTETEKVLKLLYRTVLISEGSDYWHTSPSYSPYRSNVLLRTCTTLTVNKQLPTARNQLTTLLPS